MPVSTQDQPASIGLLVMGDVVAAPGSVGHPESHSRGVVVRALHHRHLQSLALRADQSLYCLVRKEAERLVDAGAAGVVTTCGYFTPYQRGLARDLPVPVLTSSLLQLPMISSLIGGRSILVLASNRGAVDLRCLESAGVLHTGSICVRGMEGPGAFRSQVFERGVIDDVEAIAEQATRVVRQAITDNPEIGAVCIECGDLTIASGLIREQTGLPVFDYLTAVQQFRSALAAVS